jgi:hypothetical protein
MLNHRNKKIKQCQNINIYHLATVLGNEFGVENSKLHELFLFLVVFVISIERYCVKIFCFLWFYKFRIG